MKRRIRCSCVNADGTQCGRTVKDGSQPPICHIHRAAATGNPHNNATGMNQAVDRTPEEILRRLLRDSDPNVRLRALDMWQKHFENREKTPHDPYKQLLNAATDDERDVLRDLFDRLNELKDKIYQRQPDLTVDALTDDWRRRRTQALHAVEAPEPPCEEPKPTVATIDSIVHDSTSDDTPLRPLPPLVWPQVGLFSLNGVVTHALGDEYAQRILTGDIPFEEAEERQRQSERITASVNV